MNDNKDIVNDPEMIELMASIIEVMFEEHPSPTTSVNARGAVTERGVTP